MRLHSFLGSLQLITGYLWVKHFWLECS